MEFICQIASDVETTQADQDQTVAQPQPIALELLEWVSGAGTTGAPGNGW